MLANVMKGLVTQAASAIPGMSVYLSLLFRIMKDKNLHEGCVGKPSGFSEELYSGAEINLDQSGRIRLDDYELLEEYKIMFLKTGQNLILTPWTNSRL